MHFKQLFFTLFTLVTASFQISCQCNKTLSVYDFGLQKMGVTERIELLKSLNFNAIVFKVKTPEELFVLDKYLQAVKNDNSFKITAVYVPYSFTADRTEKDVWENVLKKIKGTDIKLWVIYLGDPDRNEAIATLKNMAETSKKASVEFVFYPHDNTYIETAEESVAFFKEAGVKGIYTSLHLSHELRAGNKNRLAEVAKNVAPYLKLATVSGADDLDVYDGKSGWSDTIKPLSEGNYDISPFIKALNSIGYSNEIVLHTFGIKSDPKVHLKNSMDKWKTLNSSL